MKDGIHPHYRPVVFRDRAAGRVDRFKRRQARSTSA